MTPYQTLLYTHSDLTDLLIFYTKNYFKHTRTTHANMDKASQTGIFLGYTSTMKSIYVLCDETNKVKNVTHKMFDKSHIIYPSHI